MIVPHGYIPDRMSAPRTVVVVNPNSQGGKLGKRWPEVAETLQRAFPFEDVKTQGVGDATRLTREALQSGAERIVAIGGDGTVNEVVNGFFVATADGAAAYNANAGQITTAGAPRQLQFGAKLVF